MIDFESLSNKSRTFADLIFACDKVLTKVNAMTPI